MAPSSSNPFGDNVPEKERKIPDSDPESGSPPPSNQFGLPRCYPPLAIFGTLVISTVVAFILVQIFAGNSSLVAPAITANATSDISTYLATTTAPNYTETPSVPSTIETATAPSTTDTSTAPAYTESPTTAPSTTDTPTAPSFTDTPTVPTSTASLTEPSSTDSPTAPSSTDSSTAPTNSSTYSTKASTAIDVPVTVRPYAEECCVPHQMNKTIFWQRYVYCFACGLDISNGHWSGPSAEEIGHESAVGFVDNCHGNCYRNLDFQSCARYLHDFRKDDFKYRSVKECLWCNEDLQVVDQPKTEYLCW